METILKWAGGKRQLLSELKKVIDLDKLKGHTLYEPFVGGGALFFDVEHDKVSINDINNELINVYNQIKEKPHELIELLEEHKKNHSKEYYYKIRNLDRLRSYKSMSNVEKAARTIYLNRVCFNGLYRVNSNGKFNVPCGRYNNPEITYKERILQISNYFNANIIKITNVDFEFAVKDATAGDVVYLDPPYDYEDDGFTAYTSDGFSREDLRRLKRVCDQLIERGCKVVVSNNDTPFVNDLFNCNRYVIKKVLAKRMINCKGENRSSVREVIIYGE